MAGPQAIEAQYTYLGPTVEIAPLRSGEMRQQFGLTLRAADGCNLNYTMWRFAPKSSLIVSVKSNPGLHTSQGCGNSAYRNVSPRSAMPVEAPQIGSTHRLGAVLDGTALHVFVGGWSEPVKSAWRRCSQMVQSESARTMRESRWLCSRHRKRDDGSARRPAASTKNSSSGVRKISK